MSSERTDVDIRAIFGFGAGLAGLMAVVYLIVWLLFVYLTGHQDRAAINMTSPLSAGQSERVPPEPRLQTNPKQDLRDLRAAEDELLKGYGWIDRNAGIVRIPIDEAMRITLQRGLPSRQQNQETSR